jgi:3-oxo-5-alpha-steroid 4-dehydrogenase 1
MSASVPTVVAATLAFGTCAIILHFLHTNTTPTDVEALAWLHIVLAMLTFSATLFITAPYGRHSQTSFLPLVVNAQAAWVLQECPTLINVVVMYYIGVQKNQGVAQGFFWTYRLPIVLFIAHYLHRTVIYPAVIRPRNKMPLHIMLCATAYCSFNGYLQSAANLQSNLNIRSVYLIALDDWFSAIGSSERYMISIIGVVIFVAGMTINISADYDLVRLRTQDFARADINSTDSLSKRKTHYKIPRTRLFRLVSCPNLAGEVLEWTGYGLAVLGANGVSCGLAGISFAAYAMSNLLPRALQHHRWYEETFGEAYTSLNRKAFFPYIL